MNNVRTQPEDERIWLGKKSPYLADVGDVPQVEAAIAVDAGHLVVRLVVGERHRVRVFGIGRMRGHVTDGETLGDVDAEVVRPRQSRDELQRKWTEASDDAVSAADKYVLLANHQAIGARRLLA